MNRRTAAADMLGFGGDVDSLGVTRADLTAGGVFNSTAAARQRI
jgi:hypothetical protein